MTEHLVEKLVDLGLNACVTVTVAAITATAPFLILWYKHKANVEAIAQADAKATNAVIGVKVLEKVVDVPIIKQAAAQGARDALANIVTDVPPPGTH